MIRRTISNNLLLRLEAQANEADIHGDNSIADKLTDIMVDASEGKVRGDEEDKDYKYGHKDLKSDIDGFLWAIAMRVFDYYDKLPDAREINKAVEDLSESVFSVFDNLIDGEVVGKYEDEVPGEKDMPKPDENIVEEDHVEWKITPSDEELSKRAITIEEREREDRDDDEDVEEHDHIVEDDDKESK